MVILNLHNQSLCEVTCIVAHDTSRCYCRLLGPSFCTSLCGGIELQCKCESKQHVGMRKVMLCTRSSPLHWLRVNLWLSRVQNEKAPGCGQRMSISEETVILSMQIWGLIMCCFFGLTSTGRVMVAVKQYFHYYRACFPSVPGYAYHFLHCSYTCDSLHLCCERPSSGIQLHWKCSN